MVIVKKAKRLFVVSIVVVWLVFVGLSLALFFLGPLIRGEEENESCPVTDAGVCSGRGVCKGVNGTVCFCPIEWEGEACDRFSGGIVVFGIFVFGLCAATVANAWKLFGPGSYDGRLPPPPSETKMKFG